MKKNRMMRLASILLVLVLLSTSVISGTFAKYTSSATVTDNARVAYWGFGREAAIAFNLFDASYGTTVKSEDGVNVIAPGTDKNTTFSFKYKGNAAEGINAPEVKYTVEVAATITNDNNDATKNLDENKNFVWTLKAANAAKATEYQTLAQLKAAIEALDGSDDGAAIYAPGKLPAALAGGETEISGNQEVTIGWAWKFEADNDGDTDDTTVNEDAFDTAMGNMDPLESVKIEIAITATQLEN